MAAQLDSGQLVVSGESFRTRFIGSLLDVPVQDGTEVATTLTTGNNSTTTGTTRAPDGVSAVVQGSPQANSSKVTVAGGVILAALVSALVAVVFLFVRRHNKRVRVSHSRMAKDLEESSFDHHTDDDLDQLPVSVMSDRRNVSGPDGLPNGETGHELLSDFHNDDDHFCVNVTYHSPSFSERTRSLDRSLDQSTSIATPRISTRDDFDSSNLSSSYAWDLSNSFHREVMDAHAGYGTVRRSQLPHSNANNYYGPTTIEVVPPYPMEETSESEAEDSWAQTDGSVGSLDVHLEQITAEI
jgi:hypothetical protein